jgi:RNA-directed DNA polymerase
MGTNWQRRKRRYRGLATWQLVRYADDFLVLVHGNQQHVEDLRDQVSTVLATMGLRLSPAKTRITHLADGVDFLGFRIVRGRPSSDGCAPRKGGNPSPSMGSTCSRSRRSP